MLGVFEIAVLTDYGIDAIATYRAVHMVQCLAYVTSSQIRVHHKLEATGGLIEVEFVLTRLQVHEAVLTSDS